MTSSRQLAAIMFTDIVGYTALMGHDEKKAFDILRKNRQLQKPLIETHGGLYIKELGDGTLASFSTVIDAVNCACLMIKACEDIEGLQLRIGIHLGDVVFENNDVFGDSVNIAARLQALAPVGGIWISESVHKNISNKQGIISTFVREENLKNVKEPVKIYEVDINSFHAESAAPVRMFAMMSQDKIENPKQGSFPVRKIITIALPLLALGIAGILIIPGIVKKQHARNTLIPAIEKLVIENFRPPTEAFDMGLEAEKYIAEDSALIKLWPKISTTPYLITDPAGVEVLWKDYHTPDAEWRSAGITPLIGTRFPRGYLRMEFRKEGYQTIEYAGSLAAGPLGQDSAAIKLDAIGSLPEDMVRIPKSQTYMYIVGLEQHGPKDVDAFLIDRHEVTNTAYKKFIEAGGYTDSKYWKHPIIIGGKELPFEEAVKGFLDKTGRQGPAMWEAGTYPDGQAMHPVTGVSWYEAAAYAEFAGKQLPTVFHWGVVAATARTEFIVPLSNFNGKGTIPVDSLTGISTYGLYNLAGNAREWCFNANTDQKIRYILGGGWNDPSYAFNDAYYQPAADRSLTNGFRCMKVLDGDTTTALLKPVDAAFRDYLKEKPVDDKTFSFFLPQFSYDKKPLNEKTETTLDQENWTIEKITFDAGYNNERMELYLYLPKNSKPPYQPVLFFPGSQALFTKNYNLAIVEGRIDFILKSGRALVVPIYKGTYERHDGIKSDLPEATVFYKDHVIMWRKDIGRTIDYLETRKDMQSDKIGYVGWSWGGFMGGIMPAIEKRLKAIVLNVGGMCMTPALPEVDQINFLPRITQPVLMLNGKHDMYFPVETSQKPMFNFLGTPAKDKKMILYEVGHLVPRTDFAKETLAWFDLYLGSVRE
ncbi:MAG: SUMF1/EgtB/PvdO family nonheme iron enzyme [Saprospiraceae bacterium]|nr:SUMF1/EgtB/PvdO family nonheme iron enzyme [Candidatus Opimibacter skivensis]